MGCTMTISPGTPGDWPQLVPAGAGSGGGALAAANRDQGWSDERERQAALHESILAAV